mgnify:CR=1 FL=1
MNKLRIMQMLEVKRNRLLLYHEAEAAILSGQSYEIENLRLTRAELSQVTDMIARLENEIIKLENQLMIKSTQRTRLKTVIPGGYLTCR